MNRQLARLLRRVAARRKMRWAVQEHRRRHWLRYCQEAQRETAERKLRLFIEQLPVPKVEREYLWEKGRRGIRAYDRHWAMMEIARLLQWSTTIWRSTYDEMAARDGWR